MELVQLVKFDSENDSAPTSHTPVKRPADRATEAARGSELTAADFFVFRTPLLPIEAWANWSDGLSSAAATADRSGEAELVTAVAADRALLLSRLQATITRPVVRQALFLAAPGVDREVEQLGPDGEADRKLCRTLVRYFARMTGRATPFGLFAGCSVGRSGSASRLCIAPLEQGRSFTTLDVGFLHTITEPLKTAQASDPSLLVVTNPTIYRVGDRLRYIETRSEPETLVRRYHLSAIKPTDAIDAILQQATPGATLAELAACVQSFGNGVSADAASGFIRELLECQLLIGGIEPIVTGPEPLADIIARLAQVRTPIARHVRELLTTTRQALDQFDRSGLGHTPSQYQRLLLALQTINPRLDPGRCFQVNLYKPAPDAHLDKAMTAAIADAVRLLHRITPYPGLEPLNTFRNSFADRYGSREVPLLEALDEDFGIGFDSDGPPDADSEWLPELSAASQGPSGGATWTRRDEYLLKRLVKTLADGEQVLALDDRDVEALATGPHAPLPAFFAASVTLAAPAGTDPESGPFDFLMHGLVGPSGAEFFGRLCHGDAELRTVVQDWLARQEAAEPEAIPAEIVHLQQPRDGNLVCRPHFRRHEILCLGQPSAETDDVCQIPVSDLTLRLCGTQLILRSRTLGRDIAPRLAASHYAPTADLTIYRFLWALQRQDATTLTWQWGVLAGSPFLPRVTAGRVVLCRGIWRLDKQDLAPLREASKMRGDALAPAFGAVAKLRRRRHIPRHVSLLERDKALPLDLDNVLCADLLVAEATGTDVLTLIEQFPSADRQYVTSPEGHFVHELLLPFHSSRAGVGNPASPPRLLSERTSRTVARRFPPASEWLYAKIYGSPRVLDRILVEVVQPAIRELQPSGLAKHWFFIRYWDQQPHLRVRLHGPPQRMRNEAWRKLERALRPYLDRGDIWTVQLDTYEREVERYGGHGAIEAAERFFTADSDLTVALIELDPDRAEDLREHFAVASIHALLTDIGFDRAARLTWTRTVRDSLLADLGLAPDTLIGLGRRFRTAKSSLERLLDLHPDGAGIATEGSGDDGREVIRAALHRRSPEAKAFAATLRRLERAGKLTASVSGVIASLAHMSVNRLVPRSPRTVELAILDFLHRLYAGETARSGSQQARRGPGRQRTPSQ